MKKVTAIVTFFMYSAANNMYIPQLSHNETPEKEKGRLKE